MFTKLKYQDGEPVPYFRYKCKATSKLVRGGNVVTSHTCKKHIDHEGDHECICKHTWEQKKENV